MMNQEIAREIINQLGGNRFAMMTGAKNFTFSQTEFSFKLPGSGGFTKNGINRVVITLDPSDTYTVKFQKTRGMKITEVASHSEVYCDTLASIFRNETGLETRLGTIGRQS